MKGWDLPNLSECILSDPKGEITGLEEFIKAYPLSALSADKKYFVVIRDFSSHVTDGKISILNAEGVGEKSHKGMTLAKADNEGGNYRNVILPNHLNYNGVSLDGGEIKISFDEETITTNFQEINQLWSFYKYTESEVTQIFRSFKNKFTGTQKVERKNEVGINTEHFGLLILDSGSDRYNGRFSYEEGIVQISFANIEMSQFNNNLKTAWELLAKIQLIESNMIDDMLKLKNEVWLDGEVRKLEKQEFKESIQLLAINVFEDGSISLYHSAGDLFWGHEILTHADNQGRYKNSTIAG